jgi:uncharacterized membrane protein
VETSGLEAFSDGVIAIIIAIMVLELKVPHGSELAVLAPLVPVLLSYVLSFIYVGIYWNNHHHMFQLTESVSGPPAWNPCGTALAGYLGNSILQVVGIAMSLLSIRRSVFQP